jgi:hypothetical protein
MAATRAQTAARAHRSRQAETPTIGVNQSDKSSPITAKGLAKAVPSEPATIATLSSRRWRARAWVRYADTSARVPLIKTDNSPAGAPLRSCGTGWRLRSPSSEVAKPVEDGVQQPDSATAVRAPPSERPAVSVPRERQLLHELMAYACLAKELWDVSKAETVEDAVRHAFLNAGSTTTFVPQVVELV